MELRRTAGEVPADERYDVKLQRSVGPDPGSRWLGQLWRVLTHLLVPGSDLGRTPVEVVVVDKVRGYPVLVHEWGGSWEAAERDLALIDTLLQSATVMEFCSEYGIEYLVPDDL